MRAMGAVTARTWYDLTCRTADTVWEKTCSGGGRSRWTLILGKTRINFFKGSSICPVGCDKIIESYALQVPGLFALPIRLERAVFVPYEAQDVPADRREEMGAVLEDYLDGQIGPEGEVLSARLTGGTGGMTLRAECREQIGAEVPLTEEDLAEIQRMIPIQTEG